MANPSSPILSPTSTLYPKISADIRDLHDSITSLAPASTPTSSLGPYPFTGTVKLHGTHADILIAYDPEGANPGAPSIHYQSRNRANLTPSSDNAGFATFCSTRREAILSLGAQILRHHRDQHQNRRQAHERPPSAISQNSSSAPQEKTQQVVREIIVAGEWIGKGIQKSVAVASIPTRSFALYGIRIDGVWEPIEAFPDVEVPSADIYNISRGGFQRLEFSLRDDGKGFATAAKELTDGVAELCPFGLRVFGIEGEGEGMVWTPSWDSGLPNEPGLWIKTKGEKFRIRGPPRVVVSKGDRQGKARGFAEEVCSEMRLEQGWQYMEEMGMERSRRNIWGFLSWVMGDVEAEEARDIEGRGIGKVWRQEVGRIARGWYERRARVEA